MDFLTVRTLHGAYCSACVFSVGQADLPNLVTAVSVAIGQRESNLRGAIASAHGHEHVVRARLRGRRVRAERIDVSERDAANGRRQSPADA